MGSFQAPWFAPIVSGLIQPGFVDGEFTLFPSTVYPDTTLPIDFVRGWSAELPISTRVVHSIVDGADTVRFEWLVGGKVTGTVSGRTTVSGVPGISLTTFDWSNSFGQPLLTVDLNSAPVANAVVSMSITERDRSGAFDQPVTVVKPYEVDTSTPVPGLTLVTTAATLSDGTVVTGSSGADTLGGVEGDRLTVDTSETRRGGVGHWETTVKKPPPAIITGAQIGSVFGNVLGNSLPRTASRRDAKRSGVLGLTSSGGTHLSTRIAANDNDLLAQEIAA